MACVTELNFSTMKNSRLTCIILNRPYEILSSGLSKLGCCYFGYAYDVNVTCSVTLLLA